MTPELSGCGVKEAAGAKATGGLLDAVLAALCTQGTAAACRDVAQPASPDSTSSSKALLHPVKACIRQLLCPPAASWQKQGAHPEHLSPPVSCGTSVVKGRGERIATNIIVMQEPEITCQVNTSAEMRASNHSQTCFWLKCSACVIRVMKQMRL